MSDSHLYRELVSAFDDPYVAFQGSMVEQSSWEEAKRTLIGSLPVKASKRERIRLDMVIRDTPWNTF
ncbi:MAG: hypothetical protein P1U83_00130 [Roseovarius sp.]|nr:hypothetical protein [Roseovarius sp.]